MGKKFINVQKSLIGQNKAPSRLKRNNPAKIKTEKKFKSLRQLPVKNKARISTNLKQKRKSILFITFLIFLTVVSALMVREYNKDESLLFEDVKGDYYNYAPSLFQEDENTRYVYYCSNKIEGEIADYIAFRKGTKGYDGEWKYSDVEYILSPSKNSWDERHVCDPSVIKGEFEYQGEDYQYLMGYLGCITSNNQENEVGLAVSKLPEGPWLKLENINPIADYKRNLEVDVANAFQWGYGQPSLVNLDKESTVLLSYSYGNGFNSGIIVEEWDFSNLDDPVKLNEGIAPVEGLIGRTGNQDSFVNADFAYDPQTDRIYVVSDQGPTDPEYPDFIKSSVQVSYISDGLHGYVSEILFDTCNSSWNQVGSIDKSVSGFDRNHNACILRDAYGWLLHSDHITVAYTVCNISENIWEALSQYRIYIGTIEINK